MTVRKSKTNLKAKTMIQEGAATADTKPPTAQQKPSELSEHESAETTEPATAGKVFESLVGTLLASEEDRRKRVDGRAAAVLATSSTILTIIFGLTVFVSGKDYIFKNFYAIWFLILAIVAFVASALVAIVIQAYGFPYLTLNNETLESLGDHWSDTEDSARQMWVKSQAVTIISLRSSNDKKSDLATFSLGFELAAIALLALSVAFELHTKL
ncbi:hypothetical protein [Mycolicibacterium sphagni]|uniref:Transmembrane protein n=1 Tax=Mycolicibacterium sphagni TaxID=1786 RepID=A0A255DA41_9MYCO|nr:hypothetical protein [Mycolicibacterium sphagni]OYN75491.1 hypothetical protein CG716_25080 [Mycolicibacterium sphagni]